MMNKKLTKINTGYDSDDSTGEFSFKHHNQDQKEDDGHDHHASALVTYM